MLSEQFNKPVDGSANYESPSGTHDKIIFSLSFFIIIIFLQFKLHCMRTFWQVNQS